MQIVSKSDSRARTLFLLCLLKIALIYSLIALSFVFLEFNAANYRINFIYPPGDPISLKSAFLTWDARMYSYIADLGYAPVRIQGKPYHIVSAFYPLYPMLVRIFSPILGTSLSGFFLSNLFFIAGMLIFYGICSRRYGEGIAFHSAIFVLLFPSSFFLSLIYTESLFFLLLVSLLWALENKRDLFVFLFAFLLSLTRGVGLFLVLPLFYLYFIKEKRIKSTSSYAIISAPIFGFLATLSLIAQYTGDIFSAFSAQSFFASKNSVSNIFSPIVWFKKNFLETELALHGITNSMIDRSFFFLFLIALYFIWKEQDRYSFLLALSLGLLTALMGNFCAYTRYLLVIYPIFISLAQYRQYLIGAERKTKLLCFVGLVLLYSGFVLIQVYLIVRHSLFYWAA